MLKKKTVSKKKKAVTSDYQDIASIQERAYFIWESKGKQENNALNDWLEAEQDIINKE